MLELKESTQQTIVQNVLLFFWRKQDVEIKCISILGFILAARVKSVSELWERIGEEWKGGMSIAACLWSHHLLRQCDTDTAVNNLFAFRSWFGEVGFLLPQRGDINRLPLCLPLGQLVSAAVGDNGTLSCLWSKPALCTLHVIPRSREMLGKTNPLGSHTVTVHAKHGENKLMTLSVSVCKTERPLSASAGLHHIRKDVNRWLTLPFNSPHHVLIKSALRVNAFESRFKTILPPTPQSCD